MNQLWNVKKEKRFIEQACEMLSLNEEDIIQEMIIAPRIKQEQLDDFLGRVRFMKRSFVDRNEFLSCYMSLLKWRYKGFDDEVMSNEVKDELRKFCRELWT
jgi:hypothetical protein